MEHSTKVTSFSESLSLLWTKRFGTFWVGSLLSNLGMWMQEVAEPWLVLTLSGSPVLLGLDAFAMDAPTWVLTIFGGYLADHSDRRRVIFTFQSIQMLCPLILVILMLTGWVKVWMVILLTFIVGITDALSMPAFAASVPMMVRSDQIGRAITLNSTQFSISRVLGPVMAGLVMVHYGAIGCFTVNTLSYIPFLAVILWVIPKTKRLKDVDPRILGTQPWYYELRDIARDPMLRGGLLTIGWVSLLCGPILAFAPVLVKEILHSDASHFGGLLSAFGVGGLAGAFIVLAIDRRIPRRKLSSFSALLYAAAVIGASLMRTFVGLSAVLVLAGAALTMTNTSVNSILQGSARDEIRGQTASLFMLAMRGGMSLGSLLTGFSVHFFGISHALLLNGVFAVIAQLWMYRIWGSKTAQKGV